MNSNEQSGTSGRGPSFLGIGAQRSGTTWLSLALNRHPDIFIAPIKEVHYFDRFSILSGVKTLSVERVEERLRTDPELESDWGTLVRKFFSRSISIELSNHRWMLKYLFGNYDDQWYLSLFDDANAKITGDITPAYCLLDANEVARVRQLIPDTRLLLLLRNPVDREWSSYRYTAGFVKEFSETNLELLQQHCLSPAVSKRSDYPTVIENWTACFDRKNMFVGFYDQVQQCPDVLLRQIFEFLDVDPGRPEVAEINPDRVNSSRTEKMPDDVRKFLCTKNAPLLRTLAEDFPEYGRKWLEQAEPWFSES